MSATMSEVAQSLRDSLIEYIEATYHISDPAILRQRRALLEELGVVHQAPYLESTPRYMTGDKFSKIEGLNAAAREVLETLSQPTEAGKRLLYDPPYTHQRKAVLESLVNDKNLLIMTGTGSGKTESFLMPILGKLAREATAPKSLFGEQPGVRALILYPMNALVNDQLGRLRAIFGDPRLVRLFAKWAARPPRFARYTSRTPYAGVREKKKDQRRLKSFGDFYVGQLKAAREGGEAGEAAQRLIEELSSRGKWPAKPDLERWYLGPTGRYWQDDQERFIRAVTLPDDSELVTRHEAQVAAPDLLVTNYSMLEYMLMRPIERSIFDQTKEWLERCPDEKFLLILDEAHLYRGAGGTEVGLLLRRLRDRLGIPVERFRVICASASFESREDAPRFAAELTGTEPDSFRVVDGDPRLQPGEGAGNPQEAHMLASLPLDTDFRNPDPAARARAIEPLLAYRGVRPAAGEPVEAVLHRALSGYPPLALLINRTMGNALPVESLGELLFPDVESAIADRAATNLAALASTSRERDEQPSLLPCRVHTFFRGLRGLWACLDPQCSALDPALRSGVIGKLYTQPRDICDCQARVLELYTCRVCGTAYSRGYCDDPQHPSAIWPEAGAELQVANDTISELVPLDLLLVEPGRPQLAEMVTVDLVNGRLNSDVPGRRERVAYLPPDRTSRMVDDDEEDEGAYMANAGAFHECAVCERKALQSRSPVQDHETKGDQPFQVLVNRQLQVQPPSSAPATKFAPLRGRKVLAFSDSRQVAARLAPYLQMYSARDSLRPLMVRGWARLTRVPNFQLRLEDIYTAVLLAANELDVRLRPELSLQETFTDYIVVGQKVQEGVLESDERLRDLCQEIGRGDGPPEALLADIMSTLRDRSLGLEALAVASIVERSDKTRDLAALPDIPGLTESGEDRVELVRAWLREWSRAGFWLPKMKQRWYLQHPDRKVRVTSLSGKFQKFERRLPTPAARKVFKEKWLPQLLRLFAEKMDSKYRLQGQFLSLRLGGEWVRCADCKSVHRPVRLLPVCLDCGHHAVQPLDPEADEVFAKRKGFYRRGIAEALGDKPIAPMSLIAAEHTAQLNSAEQDEVFSKAEENELLFQDVELPAGDRKSPPSAIDVLSSTTTMEVGIDIGQLPAVALRNMPPSRANYQQRAGRAGRRGNSIASVIAFGGSDTHDEHFFSRPAEMISGQVVDPTLCLYNPEIARRHVRAFLLQSYHQARIPGVQAGMSGDLFSVLGKVGEFFVPENVLNRTDFENWMRAHEPELSARVASWIPTELLPPDRDMLLREMLTDCLTAIDLALGDSNQPPVPPAEVDEDDERQYLELPPQPDDEQPAVRQNENSLLDTLLYKGVLPRYAFPTDVATFHVFDVENSTRFRPKLRFAPSQGLAVALSQYSPGRQVWISGKCYTSGAIYSPLSAERFEQWRDRRLHLECVRCGFAFTRELNMGLEVRQRIDCEACEGKDTVGPARYWMRPTGFAHPSNVPEVTSPDDLPETSYATRAKLTLRPSEETNWEHSTPQVRYLTTRTHLLVSNSGPGREGYSYCTKCGRIEASTSHSHELMGAHRKPYPDPAEPDCKGGYTSRNVVLGTDFPTDVALFSLRLAHPLRLRPADSVTKIALRTLSEALARAATDLLEIEPGEVMAEYRPAISTLGVEGLETEIFLYDTLSGGAGFAREAARKGRRLFERALQRMQNCEERCPMSCYRCLRSFRNRIDHAQLDRFLGIALVQYLLEGELPAFAAHRLATATELLQTDLGRYETADWVVERVGPVTDASGQTHGAALALRTRNGGILLVVVTNPLEDIGLPQAALTPRGEPAQLLKVSELHVRKNLARVTREVMEFIE
jgi:ATP-dependent helicase YprA (DUF1998 family)